MNINVSMIKNMAVAMGIKFPEAEEPNNPVSKFLSREIDILLPDNVDPEMLGLFRGVYINSANHDPNKALKTLVMVHKDIGELVRELQMEQYIDAHPTANIDEEDVEE